MNGLSFCLLVLLAATAQCALQTAQVQALQSIFTSLNGPMWKNSSNWNTVTDPCSRPWNGVVCDGAQQNVIQLNLANNNLSGFLPSALTSLPMLSSLKLGTNRISGSIPLSYSTLTSLTALDLSVNSFTGGAQPVASMTNLASLVLNANQFQGPLNFLRPLQQIVTFNGANNAFSGSLPSDIGTLVSLVTLNINNNQLSGSMPAAMSDLPNLHSFTAARNQFSGILPAMDYLAIATFQGNQFQCPLPVGRQYSNAVCTYCPSGFQKNAMAQCQICSPGSYSNGTFPCTLCPSGSVTILPGQAQCAACAASTFSFAGSTQCLDGIVVAQLILLVVITITVGIVFICQCCISSRFKRAFGHRMEPLTKSADQEL